MRSNLRVVEMGKMLEDPMLRSRGLNPQAGGARCCPLGLVPPSGSVTEYGKDSLVLVGSQFSISGK